VGVPGLCHGNALVTGTVIDEYYFEERCALRRQRGEAALQERTAVPVDDDDRGDGSGVKGHLILLA
jgi:hypothetical protein